jgi:hypothetical protein
MAHASSYRFKDMSGYSATLGKPKGDLSPVQEEAFQKAYTMFKATMFSVLGDTHMSLDNGRDA